MKVSSISSSAAVLYMTIFLKDTTRHINKINYDALNQPILANDDNKSESDSSEGTPSPKNIPSFYHIISLLKSR